MSNDDPASNIHQSPNVASVAIALPNGRHHYAAQLRALQNNFRQIPATAREGWFCDNLTAATLLIVGANQEGYLSSIPGIKERFDGLAERQREIGDVLFIAGEILSAIFPQIYPCSMHAERFQDDATTDTELAEYRELTFRRRCESLALTCGLVADFVEQVKETAEQAILISDDGRSVRWGANEFKFSTNEAACFKVLYEAWQKRRPEVSQEYVLETAGVRGKRLSAVFRPSGVWHLLIVPTETKGIVRLVDPNKLPVMPTIPATRSRKKPLRTK